MKPLKKAQVEGFLMYAEPEVLFGNLDELCSVSNICLAWYSLFMLILPIKYYGGTLI